MTPTNTNIDDYYSQIPQSVDDKKEGNKPTLKLKIKAKVSDTSKDEDTTTAFIIEEEKVVLTEPKENLSKFKVRKSNTISFEAPRRVEKKEEIERKQENLERFTRDEQKEKVVKIPEQKEKSEEIEKKIITETKKEESIDSAVLHAKFGQKKELKIGTGFGKDKPKGIYQNDFVDKRFGGKKSFKLKGFAEEDDGSFRRSKKTFNAKKETSVEDIRQTLVDKTGLDVAIPDFLTVKEFSEKIGVPISKIIQEFLKNGMMVNLNSKVDFDTCFIIAETFDIKVVRDKEQAVSMASILEGNISELLKNEDPSKATERSPVISIMGHVDHGKTSILDYIRKTQVAALEAGGITQKIGAYQVERDGKKITFLDTPGHEAFSIMRARGAKLTDIAIIVVAGDEGMKPQTIESINHAKEAGVPIIVAINKMDKPGANIDLVKGQMAEQGLQPEDWGGDITVVPVSAHTGLGIETLLDMIILISEMQELKANPDRSAVATIIESHLDAKLGPLATVLVNTGTLRKGDVITCANSFGRIKFLKDFKGKNIENAGPSVPVLISGLNQVVEGGDILQAVTDIEIARAKAHDYELVKSSRSINKFEGASIELLLNRIKTGNLKQLKIVLKADSNGSLEALKDALHKLSTAEIKTQIIHSGVGEINDSDVLMAGTSQAILVGYNVGYVGQAKHTLNNSKIEVINKKVIYHILEKIESIITGMIDIKHEDLDLGEAKVKQIFFTSKEKLVLGLELISGKVENKAKIRVIRDSKKAGSGEIISLKSGVMDVHEIEAPNECGIAFKGDVKVEVGDFLEFYKVVQRK